VVGKLVFVVPFVGYLPDEVKHNKNIFVFSILLPACLLILDEIKNIILYSNPTKARKVEKERKKIARRTSYVVKGNRLVTLIFISGLVFTGIVVNNLGENGHAVLGKEKTIENQGSLPLVYVLTPDDLRQRINIHFWYGVVAPDNGTQVTAP
jgi:signal peptidase